MDPVPALPADALRPSAGETLDAVLGGRLRLLQPRRGARVTHDPLFLADFVARRAPARGGKWRGEQVLDLGCGTGVIALALADAGIASSAVGLDIQPALVALARRNALLNGVADRVTFVAGDFRDAAPGGLLPGSFDLIVANPPFSQGSARVSPDAQRALSRQELACTIDDVVRAARRFVSPRGRVAVVFPAHRAHELLAVLVARRLAPRAIRPVHTIAGEPARRVLVEAAPHHRGGLSLLPPLVVHAHDRRSYTPEAAHILAGGFRRNAE